jgi:CheY-like chemotaxis protein
MPSKPIQPVLVVEDERDDVEFIRRALKKARLLNPLIIVDTVDDARAALTSTSNRPVFAIIDLFLLNHLSGLDLLEWLRAQPPPLGQLPVIVLSVSTDGTHRARASALGTVISLQKPITEEVLVDAIQGIALSSRLTRHDGRSGIVLQGR